MSLNPFSADLAIRARQEELEAEHGPGLRSEVAQMLGPRGSPRDNDGGVVARETAQALIARYGLEGPEALMLLLLQQAQTLADPPISGFFVGAVGLEAETGNLVLGGNLEFPGTHLGLTIHGEGFVFTRAFSRGTAISTIAIGEAHPCAHCRQYLSEFASVRNLVLIDPLGHRLSMADLYPWPFDPGYLGETGVVPGAVNWPGLDLAPSDLPAVTADALRISGRRAFAPYSKCPGAVVLTMSDGELFTGGSIESVAFNPTMAPLPAALINLRAHGYGPSEINEAALVTRRGGAVDYTRTTSELLAAVAPDAPLTVVDWAG